MAIPLIAVGDKIKASIINKLIVQTNAIALNGVVPTSVEGTGVSVSPNGQVTFVNTPGVSLDGVFSGTYDAYRIVVQSNNRSAASTTNIRLRSSQTDVTTGTYLWSKTLTSGTSAAVSSSTSGTASPIDDGLAAGQYSIITIDLVYPALAKPTLGTITATNSTGTGISTCQIGFTNSTAAAVDGFTMYPTGASATWSGIVRVYGYNTLA